MIVSCEKCNTKFKISQSESANIKNSGRILKCGNCHHMWMVSKSINPFSLSFSTHSPTDKPLIEQLKKQNNTAFPLINTIPDDPIYDYFRLSHIPIMLKVLCYTIIFFFIFSVSIVHKDFLISYIKPVKPILSILGLHDTKGLEFEKVKIIKSSFQKDKPLIISGYVINNSNNTLLVPDIRLQFISEDQEILKTIIHDLPVKLLLSGEKGKLSNRIDDYPEDTDTIIMDIGSYLEFFTR